MRLNTVERGHRLPQKLMLAMMPLMMRTRPPDIVRTMLYRPEFFGRPFATYMHAVMRGPSEWSVGERELFAAFVSRTNQCSFCKGAHEAVASKAFPGDVLVSAVLDDWRAAPIEEKLRAMLAFLEKLTLRPDDVTPDDIKPLRAAGLSNDAIEDAIHVCALLNVINRIADSLGFEVSSAEGFARSAQMLLKRGYRT
jgi:uncharacterized peroxidase-related enzyme